MTGAAPSIADGVDTVFFEVERRQSGLRPDHRAKGRTPCDFALQLSTLGNSGDTVSVRVYGVDVLGVQGTVASRVIHIE